MIAISAVGAIAPSTGSRSACSPKASATGSTQRVSGTTPLNLVNQGSMPCAVPLVIQPAISGPVVTASFQRCSSSGPIEVMRITGRSRKVARTRLPLRPAIHSDSTPRRPWSSTTMNGQCFSMSLRSNSISEAPLMFGMKLACGRIAFTSSSQATIIRVSTSRRHRVQACQTGSFASATFGSSWPVASRNRSVQDAQ